jgi:hypothetical protein
MEAAMNGTATKTTEKPVETNGAAIDLRGETRGKAVAVFDGVWLIATRHRPGLSKHMFEINNRCFVFRLFDQRAGKPVLLVVNGVDPEQAIPEVRRIERETGLAVSAIVSPGGGHHLLLEPWHAEFQHARVLVGPVRIPRTGNGAKLMKLPRVQALDLADPFPEFRGQLDAVLFHGLLAHRDRLSPAEGGKDSKLAFMADMVRFMVTAPRDPIDELWLHHVASQTVIGGENLTWQYPASAMRDAPMMLKGMVKPDKVAIFTAPRKVGDADQVATCWRRILSWPCRTLMTYHDAVGHAFVGDGRAALGAAVAAAKQPH